MSEPNIRNPYTNTPYDTFSFPDIPELGYFTPEARQSDVLRRRAEITKRRLLDPMVVSKATKELGYPYRIEVDVFLRSTLSHSKDIDELVTQAEHPPNAPVVEVDWTAGLPYWLQLPEVGEIALRPVELLRLANYEHAHSELLAVAFDR